MEQNQIAHEFAFGLRGVVPGFVRIKQNTAPIYEGTGGYCQVVHDVVGVCQVYLYYDGCHPAERNRSTYNYTLLMGDGCMSY